MYIRTSSRSFPAKFIRVGAYVQFGLIGLDLIPPLGRLTMAAIHSIDSVGVREWLSYVVFSWILGAPVVAAIGYTRLASEEKTGTEGLLLLFWWLSLVVMLAVAFSFGAAF